MEIYYSHKEYTSKEFLEKVLHIKGFNLSDYGIRKTAHGKPFIKELPFDFNLSHTKGMIACVLGKDVGIDCEKIREVKDSVIARVCSEEEVQKLKFSEDKSKSFILLWTFKEAFTKMLGSGFRYSFKNTTIDNAIKLHNDIKIYQKQIDDVMLTAVERVGFTARVLEIG